MTIDILAFALGQYLRHFFRPINLVENTLLAFRDQIWEITNLPQMQIYIFFSLMQIRCSMEYSKKLLPLSQAPSQIFPLSIADLHSNSDLRFTSFNPQ